MAGDVDSAYQKSNKMRNHEMKHGRDSCCGNNLFTACFVLRSTRLDSAIKLSPVFNSSEYNDALTIVGIFFKTIT